MRDDDRPTSKRESEFSPSYSQLPPREIYIFEQEEISNAPLDAAVTPARDNLTTKTTDITEPDIPSAPRLGAKHTKKFNFEVVSSSTSEDRNASEYCDSPDDKDEKDGIEKNREASEKRLESVVEHGNESSAISVSDDHGAAPNRTSETNWYFCGADESVPYDESSRKPDPPEQTSKSLKAIKTEEGEEGKLPPPRPESPRKRRSLASDDGPVQKSPKNSEKDQAVAEEDEIAKYTEESSEIPTVTEVTLSPRSLLDEVPAVDGVDEAPSDELENRASPPPTTGTECSPFEELCMKLKSFLL